MMSWSDSSLIYNAWRDDSRSPSPKQKRSDHDHGRYQKMNGNQSNQTQNAQAKALSNSSAGMSASVEDYTPRSNQISCHSKSTLLSSSTKYISKVSDENLAPGKGEDEQSSLLQINSSAHRNEQSHSVASSRVFPQNGVNPSQLFNRSLWIKANKPGQYDYNNEDQQQLQMDTNGIRVSYENYTTIEKEVYLLPFPRQRTTALNLDWIHDMLKDKARFKSLRSIKGFRGMLVRWFDSAQAWILILIIGIICGILASCIDFCEEWLKDIRSGLCVRNIRLNQRLCCYSSKAIEKCESWKTWGDLVYPKVSKSDLIAKMKLDMTTSEIFSLASVDLKELVNFTFFFMLSVLMAILASLLVVKFSSKNAVRGHRTLYKRARKSSNTSILSCPTDLSGLNDETSSIHCQGTSAPKYHGSQNCNISHVSAFCEENLTVSSLMNEDQAHQSLSLNEEEIITSTVYYTSGSGIPELKTVLSGFVIRGFLGLRTLIIKTIGLTFAISSGLMIGKQGPLIHICCCIGNVLSRLFSKYALNDGKRREILSAASAAGVSVAFAAPIGGVLFSLEEVSYYFPFKTMWRTFFCAMIATVTIKLIDPLGTGKGVLFQVSFDHNWYAVELIPFALVGVLGGLYGAFFISVSTFWTQFKQQRKVFQTHPIYEVLVVIILTSVMNYWMPLTKLSNGELIAGLFNDCKENDSSWICSSQNSSEIMKLLATTLIAKMFLMIVTFGIKVPAGFFMPSMIVGACIGRLVGVWANTFVSLHSDWPLLEPCHTKSCVIPGVYAMVGATAALCGVTRMTVSLAIIMFELTGSLTHVLPIMVAIMVSKWIADALSPDSLYDRLTFIQGHPYLDHKKSYSFEKLTTVDILEAEVEVFDVNYDYTLEELEVNLEKMDRIKFSDDGGFPIVNNAFLVGYIAANELDFCLEKSKNEGTYMNPFSFQLLKNENGEYISPPASPILPINYLCKFVDKAPLVISINSPPDLIIELFKKLGVKTLCVTNEKGHFVGLIHKKRLMSFLRNQY